MISYISRATSLVRGSTSESTFTLMGRLPKVTSMMSPSFDRLAGLGDLAIDEDAARIGHLICHGAALDEPRNFQVFIQSHVMILQKSRPSPSLRFVHRRTSGQGSWQREALTERFYKKTAGTTAAPAVKIKLTGYPSEPCPA